jgi:CDP-glycerol glycerophosphotransferase
MPRISVPRISVVVPAYNIEPYLAECLQSIADQTVADLEVIVVDDGSTDGTAQVAAAFAARDPRFEVLTQRNGGLGHARNAGAARVHGEFLSFVDGDDILPRRAYEILLGALDTSGSDFATGNVHRFDEFRTWQSAMLGDALTDTELATHITRRPELLADRIAPNKLWRRSFWDKHGLCFPEGVYHEDISVVVPAHVLAESVDVISEPCYLYRYGERETAGPSITQRRLEPRTIRDRTQAVDAVSRFLAARNPKLKRQYDKMCADQDFRYTLEKLDEADDEFRDLFVELVNDFFDRSHRGVFDDLPAIARLEWYLVRHRMLPELIEVLRFDKTREFDRTRDVRRGRHIYGNLPFFDDPVRRIPKRVYRLDRELRMRRQVDDVWWEGSRLVIEGHAYINRINMIDPADSTVRLTLEAKDGRLLELPVERTARPDVTAAVNTNQFDYTWSGFRTSVDVSELLPPEGRPKNAVWRLVADVKADGWRGTRRVMNVRPGRAQRPQHLHVRGCRVVPVTKTGRFGINVDRLAAVVESWRADDGVLQIEGRARARDLPTLDVASARLLLHRESESGQLSYPVSLTGAGDGALRLLARIPTAALADAVEVGDQASHAEDRGDGIVWTVSLLPAAGEDPVALAHGDALPHFRQVLGEREVLLGATRQGALTVIERGLRPVATCVRWADHHLEITGDYPAAPDETVDLVIAAVGSPDTFTFPVLREGHAFRVTVPVGGVPTLAGTLPLTTGTWTLHMRKAGAHASSAPLKITREVLLSLPQQDLVGKRVNVLRYADFDSVSLDVGPDLLADEVGGFNQQRLQNVEFPAFVRQGVREAVLFEGYAGVQYADSPRAIAEELHRRGTGLELIWAVADGQTELPDYLTPVARESREWYEATARSRYAVMCSYRSLGGWLEPHPDQVVLQTWHGPPFKRIGFDNDRMLRTARRDYAERLAFDVAHWNYLISPSPAATPVLRSAFRYDGTVLETGYPRTDIFFRPDREQIAARLRARLGLPEGKKVVLYAPTFRDDQRVRGNRFSMQMNLDLRHAERALGDDHVLLVRRHVKMSDSLPAAGDGFVRDVSRWPEVNELLLITDVLITDYSSLMFDFANTGRPILFFTYDLEAYRDELRGFYFDFGIVPGPLLRTSPEVVEAVASADDVRAKYDGAYRAFQEKFCAFDDGTASAEVVSTVFGADAGPSLP